MAPKKKILKKWKNHPPDIYPRNKCAKFHKNRTIFEISRLPQSFTSVLGQKGSQGPKNEDFEKMKKTSPDIHIRNKCAKFQKNQSIFEVYGLPQSFSLVLGQKGSQGPKNENFEKMKKPPPDIHPRNKCAKKGPMAPKMKILKKLKNYPQIFT